MSAYLSADLSACLPAFYACLSFCMPRCRVHTRYVASALLTKGGSQLVPNAHATSSKLLSTLTMICCPQSPELIEDNTIMPGLFTHALLPHTPDPCLPTCHAPPDHEHALDGVKACCCCCCCCCIIVIDRGADIARGSQASAVVKAVSTFTESSGRQ